MSASRAPAPPFVHIVVRRLLLPVWNALVAYGSLWLPADQYRLQYIRGGALPPPPWQEPVPELDDVQEDVRQHPFDSLFEQRVFLRGDFHSRSVILRPLQLAIVTQVTAAVQRRKTFKELCYILKQSTISRCIPRPLRAGLQIWNARTAISENPRV